MVMLTIKDSCIRDKETREHQNHQLNIEYVEDANLSHSGELLFSFLYRNLSRRLFKELSFHFIEEALIDMNGDAGKVELGIIFNHISTEDLKKEMGKRIVEAI